MPGLKPNWSELMRAANRGDARAYGRLLQELAPVLRRMVSRSLHPGSSVDPEDVVQDTLLALHLKRQTWDDSRPLLPWVQAIARNKLADSLRRRPCSGLPIEDIAETLAAEPATISDGLDVRRVLTFLEGKTREIVTSISIEGASARQVAKRFGMTEGAVRVAFHRGVNSMARAVSSR